MIDIDKIMHDIGVNQKELAAIFGVSSPAISRYKKGEMSFPASWKEVLRDKYKVNLTKYDTIEETRNPKQAMIPYYSIDVFGTPGAEIVDGTANALTPEFYISIPELKNVEMYIRVRGDSMYPRYKHGDIIGIKELDSQAFFVWYEPYVVVTKGNYQRLLKYIHPHETDIEKVMLVSYDSAKFRPQPLDKEDIFKLYEVRGKIEL